MNRYQDVDEFISTLPPDIQAQVLEIRRIILEADPGLLEHIKWNAPSYVKNGEDRITFNFKNKDTLVRLVLHMGATKKEDRNSEPVLKDSILVHWVSDIRGYVTFQSIEQIKDQENEIAALIQRWLALE